MRDLLGVSMVVLLGMAVAHFFAFRMYRREFFRFVGLAWISNAAYLVMEVLTGSAAESSLGVGAFTYFVSLGSSLFLFVAYRDLRESTDPRSLIPAMAITSMVVVLAAIFVWSWEPIIGGASLEMLVLPGTFMSSWVLIRLALSFRNMSNHQMLEFLHKSDQSRVLFVIGVDERKPESFGSVSLGTSVTKPLEVARWFYIVSFGGYGLIQWAYYIVQPSQQWPFWTALVFKLASGAALPVWLLADFRYVSETVRRKSVFQELGFLTATIEHDVRGPVSTMTKVLLPLRVKYQQDAHLIKNVSLMSKQLNRIMAAADIIPAMREGPEHYAKNLLPWNPLELCRTAVGELKLQYEEQLPKVEFIAQKTTLEITCYRERFLQALVNIINNSIEALRGNGSQDEDKISINILAAPGNRLRIVVHDNGPGIATELLPKVTLPSFSTKYPNTDKANRGLGLYIADRIVQQHGGVLSVRSDGESFTEVTIDVPLLLRKQ